MSAESDLERRCLQIVIAIAACVPVVAGAFGLLKGTGFLDLRPNISADSHIRYLSGLLFAIGLAFWASIPHIEKHGGRIALLTAIVFVGGLARLLGLLVEGVPNAGMLFGLLMELIVTPSIWLWQRRVARQ